MITRENLDECQGRLLNLLTALFEQQPFLDTTSAAAVYPQLRVDLLAAGATDSDFECLAVRVSVPRSADPCRISHD
jgi:hypothetical protein